MEAPELIITKLPQKFHAC